MDPEKEIPTGSFEEHKSAEFADIGVKRFKIRLSDGANSFWLGRDNNGWCVRTDYQPLVLEYLPYEGEIYYKVSGEDYYLSISNDGYLGCYKWWGASTFHPDGKYLVSDWNGQHISYYSRKDWIYAWDNYAWLEVEFVEV